MPVYFFFFNDTATTEIYTLSLHDTLPISADHHHLGVENVHDIGHARSQELRRVVHDFQSVLVAVVRRFVHDLRGDLGQIAIDVARQGGVRAGFDSFDRPRRDRRPGRVGLETAVVAALAAPTVGVDGHVAD